MFVDTTSVFDCAPFMGTINFPGVRCGEGGLRRRGARRGPPSISRGPYVLYRRVGDDANSHFLFLGDRKHLLPKKLLGSGVSTPYTPLCFDLCHLPSQVAKSPTCAGRKSWKNGKWKMENGKWKMENGEWKICDASGQLADLRRLQVPKLWKTEKSAVTLWRAAARAVARHKVTIRSWVMLCDPFRFFA